MKTEINLTPFNVGMFAFFTIGALVFLYRIAPLALNFSVLFTKAANLSTVLKAERKNTWTQIINVVPMSLLLIYTVIWMNRTGGKPMVVEGTKAVFSVTSSFLPMMLVLFPVMALGMVVAKHFQADIAKVLTGTFGYVGTLLSACGLPTANSAMGAIKEHWKDEALRPILQYFLTASALVCWPVFFVRALGFDWEIAIPMYRTNWIVAIVIMPGFIFWSRVIACGGLWKATVSILHIT